MIVRFFIALQFLSTIPIRLRQTPTDRDYPRALFYFPLVGLLLGIAIGAPYLFFHNNYSPGVIASLSIVLSVMLTGALHVDGLADSCDGFFSGTGRDRILEIMRDSRIGTMGALAIGCDLLLRFSLLSALNQFGVIVLTTTFSRWVQVLGCYLSRYPQTGGKGGVFIGKVSTPIVVVSGVFLLLFFMMFCGWKCVFSLGFSLLPVGAFIYYCHKKIGGMTGDNIGALNEIAEIAMLFVFFSMT